MPNGRILRRLRMLTNTVMFPTTDTFISAVSFSIISVVRSVGSAVGDAISAVCGHHDGPLKLVAAEPEVQHR
jgi:hypothetical protein